MRCNPEDPFVEFKKLFPDQSTAFQVNRGEKTTVVLVCMADSDGFHFPCASFRRLTICLELRHQFFMVFHIEIDTSYLCYYFRAFTCSRRFELAELKGASVGAIGNRTEMAYVEDRSEYCWP